MNESQASPEHSGPTNSGQESPLHDDLTTSKRFAPPKERRDFLGLAALWSAIVALGWGLLGALRLPMPSVFPESNPRVKLGPMSDFEGVNVTPFPEERLWVFSQEDGLYAISSVCTHLGCIAKRSASSATSRKKISRANRSAATSARTCENSAIKSIAAG